MVYEEDLEVSLAGFERAIDQFLALGDSHQALVAMTNAGDAAFHLGMLDRQLELYNDALKLARQTGNVRVEARCLQGLAERDLMAGQAAPAAEKIVRSSQIYESFVETAEVVVNLALAAWALGVAGLPERGAVLMFAANRSSVSSSCSSTIGLTKPLPQPHRCWPAGSRRPRWSAPGRPEG